MYEAELRECDSSFRQCEDGLSWITGHAASCTFLVNLHYMDTNKPKESDDALLEILEILEIHPLFEIFTQPTPHSHSAPPITITENLTSLTTSLAECIFVRRTPLFYSLGSSP